MRDLDHRRVSHVTFDGNGRSGTGGSVYGALGGGGAGYGGSGYGGSGYGGTGYDGPGYGGPGYGGPGYGGPGYGPDGPVDPGGPPLPPGAGGSGGRAGPGGRPPRRRRRRRRLLGIVVGGFVVLLVGFTGVIYAAARVPLPAQIANKQISTITYADGTVLARIGPENRTDVPLSTVPEQVRWAVLAAENRTFYTDPGISAKGILRAAWNDLHGGDVQGGSGITQQYVKNAYLTQER